MQKKKKEFTTSIQHVDAIIADIQDQIDRKKDFVAFILIALGIEFIGVFFDDKDFNEFSLSETRFKKGITQFKDNWYKNNADWLFKEFRCPLIHEYRTGKEILLTSVCKNTAPLGCHLEKLEGKRVFILERLFDDFKLAVKRLKNQVRKQNSLNNDKLKQEQQSIYNIKTITYKAASSAQNDVLSQLFAVSGKMATPPSVKLDSEMFTYNKDKRKNKKKNK